MDGIFMNRVISPPLAKRRKTTSTAATKNNNKEDSKDEIYPASLRAFLHRHHWLSILFLQEVKIASKDTKTQDAVRTAINSPLLSETSSNTAKGPLYDAYFTLPTDPHNARDPRGSRKVYGVGSILRRDLTNTYTGTVRTVDWDREGRVSIVELTCRATLSKLAIFNIYAVNSTDCLYRDKRSGVVQGTRHDRKREFHRLLMNECKGLEEKDWDVLLAGDMNVAPDERDGYPKLWVFPRDHVVNRANFHDMLLEKSDEEKKTVGLNGIDIWRKMHEQERRYTYYPRNRE
ncbi:hypothetical protein COCSADRAFT_181270 [Bipolaris sorokiniana ND90Pr]|uniref:Endonuclease/exonuclease/phosphatase domain-containing protein n=1 Tax=Cochliobolus sativus (strain ND90Pr / ATCC 201652) TaxID=665912 RepID=M2S9Y1_COCSN|nr:uncharacterized protein COCSADRAFT_181270 [Bipolaris sorokiniana ND90Pr]EMD64098.1 hypothetical protein COCSADRAFT_181270 [Bipolaris sorokiniana ND90Pr]